MTYVQRISDWRSRRAASRLAHGGGSYLINASFTVPKGAKNVRIDNMIFLGTPPTGFFVREAETDEISLEGNK